MKNIELAKLLAVGKDGKYFFDFECPCLITFEDEEEMCTRMDSDCDRRWNQEVPSDTPIVALFERYNAETADCMPDKLKAEIKANSEFYSKRRMWLKAIEELVELLTELKGAGNPFESEDVVNYTPNTWDEEADVYNVLDQIVIQNGKEELVAKIRREKMERQCVRRKEESVILSGGVVKCESKEDMLEKHAVFAKDGIGTGFCYERDGQEGFWLISRQEVGCL